MSNKKNKAKRGKWQSTKSFAGQCKKCSKTLKKEYKLAAPAKVQINADLINGEYDPIKCVGLPIPFNGADAKKAVGGLRAIRSKYELHFYQNRSFYEEIHRDGYAVRPLEGITIEDLKEAQTLLTDKNRWLIIRDENERMQRSISKSNKGHPIIAKIFGAVKAQLPPGTVIEEEAVLSAKAGTKAQKEIHTDKQVLKAYKAILDSNSYFIPPLSIIAALQQACNLIIYPGSHRFWVMTDEELAATLPINAIVVRIEPKEALYFRTDLWHQGGFYRQAEYPNGNYRLHCFAYSVGPGNQLGLRHSKNKFNSIDADDNDEMKARKLKMKARLVPLRLSERAHRSPKMDK